MALKLYLLDTNTAIDYISGILPAKAIAWLDSVLDQEVAISVINQIEATALEKNLILLSRNNADFKSIANLRLRNLHDMT